jgi:hypothetical protein
VVFPESNGSRSTSALGRAVVAGALRPADPVGAAAAERETNWRHGYVTHFRRLVEAGLVSEAAAVGIAGAGLAEVHQRMRVTTQAGDLPVDEVFLHPEGHEPLETGALRGTATPSRDLSIPMHGVRLRGDALHRQLDAWTAAGVMEPSAAEQVRAVAANPDWLDLSDLRLVLLGAGAEMGPLRAVLSWGAEVVGVDLPRPEIWKRLGEVVRRSAGTLRFPLPAHAPRTSGDRADDVAGAGADLLHHLPPIADWLAALEGPVVLGNYVYADGAVNMRVSTAVDALTSELQRRRSDLSLAFLATPTDVFGVPADAVAHATQGYRHPSAAMRVLRPALRTVSGGRLLRRNYAPGENPGLNDSLVPQQGPNYALAKRIQRWRATVARREGVPVSMHVAPPTRTRSVLKNRALASAYAGAHRFGVEVFEPATSNTLMAALLVHDLRTPSPPLRPPWLEEADGAVHGGLWRTAYDPRSALGLAVVLGLGGARG